MALRYLGVTPRGSVPMKLSDIADRAKDGDPADVTYHVLNDSKSAPLGPVAPTTAGPHAVVRSGEVKVPDLSGLPAREAVKLVIGLGSDSDDRRHRTSLAPGPACGVRVAEGRAALAGVRAIDMTACGERGGRGHAERAEPGLGIPLGDLVREIPGATLSPSAPLATIIHGVHHDSRRIEPGDLFVARAGGHVNGAAFIDDAIARGAIVVLSDRNEHRPFSVPTITVNDVPAALAFASSAVYGHPTFALDVVGITGTNGKTTTSLLTSAAIDACGGRTGVIGTLGSRFAGVFAPSKHTSPEADEVARIARSMLHRGATHLVMEVSSIAVAAKRAEAIRFRVAAFTNLTQNHLDYHGTMRLTQQRRPAFSSSSLPGRRSSTSMMLSAKLLLDGSRRSTRRVNFA